MQDVTGLPSGSARSARQVAHGSGRQTRPVGASTDCLDNAPSGSEYRARWAEASAREELRATKAIAMQALAEPFEVGAVLR